jgi:hypothetical protein
LSAFDDLDAAALRLRCGCALAVTLDGVFVAPFGFERFVAVAFDRVVLDLPLVFDRLAGFFTFLRAVAIFRTLQRPNQRELRPGFQRHSAGNALEANETPQATRKTRARTH